MFRHLLGATWISPIRSSTLAALIGSTGQRGSAILPVWPNRVPSPMRKTAPWAEGQNRARLLSRRVRGNRRIVVQAASTPYRSRLITSLAPTLPLPRRNLRRSASFWVTIWTAYLATDAMAPPSLAVPSPLFVIISSDRIAAEVVQ